MNKVISRFLCVFCLAALTACVGDPLKFSSKNDPADDASALRLVGITLSPAPAVLFRDFQAGIDDSMRLVVRFPKSQLAAFWAASPWKSASRQELNQATPDVLTKQVNLPKDTQPVWARWMTSTHGIASSAAMSKGQWAKIFVALDQDADDAIAYIFWNET